MFCVGFAFNVGSISATVLESINKIGSAFYGPIFAVFLMGITTRRARPLGAIVGLAAGVGLNLGLWVFAPNVSWLWWNAFGFIVAAALILLLGKAAPEKGPVFEVPAERPIWKMSYVALALFTVAMIGLLTTLPILLGS